MDPEKDRGQPTGGITPSLNFESKTSSRQQTESTSEIISVKFLGAAHVVSASVTSRTEIQKKSSFFVFSGERLVKRRPVMSIKMRTSRFVRKVTGRAKLSLQRKKNRTSVADPERFQTCCTFSRKICLTTVCSSIRQLVSPVKTDERRPPSAHSATRIQVCVQIKYTPAKSQICAEMKAELLPKFTACFSPQSRAVCLSEKQRRELSSVRGSSSN